MDCFCDRDLVGCLYGLGDGGEEGGEGVLGREDYVGGVYYVVQCVRDWVVLELAWGCCWEGE